VHCGAGVVLTGENWHFSKRMQIPYHGALGREPELQIILGPVLRARDAGLFDKQRVVLETPMYRSDNLLCAYDR
jgi:hypothetical protein